jgi:hypothetical protein
MAGVGGSFSSWHASFRPLLIGGSDGRIEFTGAIAHFAAQLIPLVGPDTPLAHSVSWKIARPIGHRHGCLACLFVSFVLFSQAPTRQGELYGTIAPTGDPTRK